MTQSDLFSISTSLFCHIGESITACPPQELRDLSQDSQKSVSAWTARSSNVWRPHHLLGHRIPTWVCQNFTLYLRAGVGSHIWIDSIAGDLVLLNWLRSSASSFSSKDSSAQVYSALLTGDMCKLHSPFGWFEMLKMNCSGACKLNKTAFLPFPQDTHPRQWNAFVTHYEVGMGSPICLWTCGTSCCQGQFACF